jgi:hypothetical protein
LVVRTADAAGLHFDHRLDVVQRDDEDLERVLAGLLLDLLERAVDDALGDGLLADSMMTFMNLDRSTEPNFGSGRMSRLGTSRRRGISLFLLLQLARASPPPRTHRHRGPTYSKPAD